MSFLAIAFLFYIYSMQILMRKAHFTAVIILSFFISAKGQLTNTKWKATFNVPSPVECVLDFRKDTVVLFAAADSSTIETMIYKVDKDTFSLEKISGGSPCDYQIQGKYKFEIRDEKMMISLIADSCNERVAAWPSDALQKVK